jgi:alpha-1,2-rhamnosyltransferase
VSDKLAVQPGDILVLLDSSWHLSIWPAVQAFKDDGGKVVAVIYDIIPIRYPQYCDDRLTLAFKDWLDQSLKLVDGYTAISKSVKMDLYKYLETRASPEEINTKFFSHFHLGADFSTSLSGIGESQIKSIFDNNQKVFLTACTLEPRKNHSQILDSAEILWSQGEDFALLFIGKIGWKIDELLKRIKSHPEYNLRLFLLSNASDQELVFAYKHATALVFASYAEGFGLPIIESLHHSLPVVASDIPVHREIGKDSITYFKLNDSDDLALKMQKLEKGGGKKNTHTIQAQNYTWKSSSKQLFLAVHQLTLR